MANTNIDLLPRERKKDTWEIIVDILAKFQSML